MEVEVEVEMDVEVEEIEELQGLGTTQLHSDTSNNKCNRLKRFSFLTLKAEAKKN